ncbi:S-layer homology domain-containing protein [Bacillus horti]|uniref:SLH domain-containing protein n=1 Tax=Caldalkalibacillus horti TaxID=77523 RepID=A0ABT9W5G5_9BACI|nr:S-layer homology domain-containing protein [Bacillus horti]MDQ0168492.1 hypothetical protein [Bacillus horti]
MRQAKALIPFIIICTLLFSLLGWPLSEQKAYAAYTYEFRDTASSTQLNGSGISLFEQYMVWYKADAAGNRQIHFQNLQTGEAQQITDVASAKESPRVGINSKQQPVVVWNDKRNHDRLQPLWDIYAYNVATQEEIKLNTAQGQLVAPTIHGDYVVWHDLTGREMYVYDLNSGQASSIGKGRYPVVAKGQVLYQNVSDGGLSLYNIQSKQTKKVVELPYHEYVFGFTFNGDTALWLKTDLDGRVTYSFARTTEQEITVKDLTTPKKQEVRSSSIVLGERYGAWLEVKNGVAQIVGVDLTNSQAYPITQANTNQTLYGFNGDRLMMKDAQGNLIYRTIIAINNSDSGSPSTSPTTAKTAQKKIGATGGSLEISKLAHVHIPAGVFSKESLVSMTEQQQAIQNLQSNMVSLSKAIELSSEFPFEQDAQLTLHFDLAKIVPHQLKKVGIYTFNKETSSWSIVGGVADVSTSTVQSAIKQPGVYAVMLYDKTFTDIQKHWAQQEIETLAARWIVNGVNEERFAPNQSVTRAEFIKMLTASLGLEPIETKQSSFTDVPASHWASSWIEAGYQAGIVQGSQGKFHSNQTITREEMMTMLVRALGLEESTATQQTLLTFKDHAGVSSWAKPYVALAIEQGLITGTGGEIQPAQASTRAMAAVVMYRLLEKEKKL